MDLDEPVDDDLAVREADSGMDEHGIADRQLGPDHRGAVREARDHGDPPALAAGLDAVEHQGAEGVTHAHESYELANECRLRREAPVVAALAPLQREVREHGFFEPRMALLHRPEKRAVAAPHCDDVTARRQ